jgi:hypothetical protein
MRIAFIVDPLPSLKAYKDTSIAMMRAAQAAGHAVWTVQQEAIHWSPLHGVCAEAVHLEMLADDQDWFVEVDRMRRRAARFSRRADAQGSALRHGVRDHHLAARTCRSRGRARLQSAARLARSFREVVGRRVRAVFGADTGGACAGS